jgi:hypothetical protein
MSNLTQHAATPAMLVRNIHYRFLRTGAAEIAPLLDGLASSSGFGVTRYGVCALWGLLLSPQASCLTISKRRSALRKGLLKLFVRRHEHEV